MSFFTHQYSCNHWLCTEYIKLFRCETAWYDTTLSLSLTSQCCSVLLIFWTPTNKKSVFPHFHPELKKNGPFLIKLKDHKSLLQKQGFANCHTSEFQKFWAQTLGGLYSPCQENTYRHVWKTFQPCLKPHERSQECTTNTYAFTDLTFFTPEL